MIENFLRSYVTAETREDLITTRAIVSRLLGERRARLHELGIALVGDALTRALLTDRTLDRPTRDDVVENEILPSYPQLGLMAVLDGDGSTRALSGTAQALEPTRSGAWPPPGSPSRANPHWGSSATGTGSCRSRRCRCGSARTGSRR